jgi:hypothetical protein
MFHASRRTHALRSRFHQCVPRARNPEFAGSIAFTLRSRRIQRKLLATIGLYLRWRYPSTPACDNRAQAITPCLCCFEASVALRVAAVSSACRRVSRRSASSGFLWLLLRGEARYTPNRMNTLWPTLIGAFLGFAFGVGCALAVMYSIYMGGYRAAVRDAQLAAAPPRYQKALQRLKP